VSEDHWRLYEELIRWNLGIAEGMNKLNDKGLISDLCTHLSDIALVDVNRCLTYLALARNPKKP
jgi:hypothetical protein